MLCIVWNLLTYHLIPRSSTKRNIIISIRKKCNIICSHFILKGKNIVITSICEIIYQLKMNCAIIIFLLVKVDNRLNICITISNIISKL